MLQNQVILKYIRTSISIFLLSFMWQSNAQIQSGDEVEKIVAWVDNEIILKSELDITEYQFRNNYSIDNQDISCDVLETMVLNKLMIAKSKIDSVFVEEDQLNNELDRRIQQLFMQYGGSPEKVLQEYGKTLEELKNELRSSLKEQMLIQKMQEKVTGSINVTPLEVKQFYKKIDKDSLPKFSTTVEIGQIVRYSKPNELAKETARRKLEDIKKQIEGGADFAELARKYSVDPGSAKLGGELGFFKKGELVPEYEAAALTMRPGMLSEVVESQFGFHLIQLIERRGNEFNSRHILLKPETSYRDINAELNLLDSIRTMILKDSIQFTQAATKYNEDQILKSTNGFMTDYEGNYRISVEKLGTMYFTIEDMTPGEITKPLTYITEDGKDAARLIYLKAKTPPHVANLSDDYQQLKEAALTEKKNKILENWFQETRKEIYVQVDSSYNYCKILD
jgi:peptidyl-prolyl cis-trans isomerase SurA